MADVNPNQHLVKIYGDKAYQYPTMIRHKGTVLAFAMESVENNGPRQIYYTVLDLSGGDQEEKGPLDAAYWLDTPRVLPFSNEITQVGFSVVGNTVMPTVKQGGREEGDPTELRPDEIDPFLSTTARLTADAPFTVLSDNQYIYVFRQAIAADHRDIVYQLKSGGASGDLTRPDTDFVLDRDGNKVPIVNETLLCDRFVLAGTTLQANMEVRYRRSRHKTRPASNKDSLGTQDMNGVPFFEPTQELPFIRNLQEGRFDVLLLPTQVADIKRWQLFAYNGATERIDSFNIERSSEGLFNTQGTQFYTSPDPEYQASVFERQPGTCPFTDEPLVPIVSLSGYAETALEFDGSQYIDCGDGINLANKSFTIEFWAKRGNLTDQQCIIGQAESVRPKSNSGLLAGFRDDNRFFLAFWGNAINTTTVYTDTDWHHWVCTYDHNTKIQKLYQDGTLAVDPRTATSNCLATGNFFIGCRFDQANKFRGTVDEVRIWDVARSAEDIKASMNQRLIGNEPGLVAYYRFDEGQGTTLFDQTDNGHHGTIHGATWVTLDAPLGDNPGMRASSFTFQGRTIESGLTAGLYYQQEEQGDGKPMKQNARVMLAVATGGPDPNGGSTTNDAYVAALDLAVSREGRLAQVPDQMALDPITTGQEAWQQGEIALELYGQVEGNRSSPIWPAPFTIELWAKATGDIGTKWSLKCAPDEKSIEGDDVQQDKWTHLAAVYTGDDDQKLRLYIDGVEKGEVGNVTLGSFDQVVIAAGEPSGNFEGQIDDIRIWNVARTAQEITNNKDRQLNGNEPNLVTYYKVDEGQGNTLSDGTTGGRHATIEGGVWRRAIDELPELPMKHVHTDPFGLTVSGGLLGFAPAWSTPLLFDSAVGQISLYFQQSDGQFMVAYYDTMTSRARYELIAKNDNDQERKVYLTARSAGSDTGDLTIEVAAGSDTNHCDVTINSLTAGIWETWPNVPRKANLFAAVLNGQPAEPIYVGQLSTQISGSLSSLPLQSDVKRTLPLGTTLRIGESTHVTTTAKSDSQSAVSIEPETINEPIPANTPVYRLPYYYDYANATVKDNAGSDKLGYSLQNGSLLVVVVNNAATSQVQNGQASQVGSMQDSRWVPDAPGDTYSFENDSPDFVKLPDDKLAQVDAPSDLTLEAWVNPATLSGDVPVIYHHSDKSQYALALRNSESGYYVFAKVGDNWIQSKDALPIALEWTHLAATYNQTYALQFAGGDDVVECGNNIALNLDKALTLEVMLKVTELSDATLLLKGDETQDTAIPYKLSITSDGQVVFTFRDKDGNESKVETGTADDKTDTGVITADTFHKVAVVRREYYEQATTGSAGLPKTGNDVTGLTPTGSSFSPDQRDKIDDAIREDYVEAKKKKSENQKQEQPDGWGSNAQLGDFTAGYGNVTIEVEIYVDNVLVKGASFSDMVIDGNDGILRIGQGFEGLIDEARLWGRSLAASELGAPITEGVRGLVACWQFEENEGNVAYDRAGESHGQIKGAKWAKSPDPQGSPFKLYYNGTPLITIVPGNPPTFGTANQFALGGILDHQFTGMLEEVRVWRVARTQEQILDNLFTRLKEEKQDLLGYYTFDGDDPNELRDQGLRGNHLGPNNSIHLPTINVSTAPISNDTAEIRSALAGIKTQFQTTIDSSPAVQEYGDMQYDSEGNMIGSFKRCYSYIKNGQWTLLTGYKVGELITEWVGQAQFDPQIIGYVEGAPPMPGENLTAGPKNPDKGENYVGDAYIEVIKSDSVLTTYSASKEKGYENVVEASGSLGVEGKTQILVAPFGFGISFPIEASATASVGGGFQSEGSWAEDKSVQTGRTRTRTLRVELGGTWENEPPEGDNSNLSQRFLPDNIGFALVISQTADIYAQRLKHNNALIAYQFQPNPDIPADWNLIPFPINPRYIKQGTLDGKVGFNCNGGVQMDPDYPPNATGYREFSYFKPKEAYALKKRIEKEQQALANYYQNYKAATFAEQTMDYSLGLGLLGDLGGLNLTGLLSAGLGFTLGNAITSGKQYAQMRDIISQQDLKLPEKIGKRNIVNTYVWTAAGGFYSDTTETLDVWQESMSGSYSVSNTFGTGFEVEISVPTTKLGAELSSVQSGSMNLTQSKSQEASSAFQLEVSVDPPGDLSHYENNCDSSELQPGDLVPGKVDAYRFMTFYLESDKSNFEDLFSKVVDPIWISQSRHPNAVAMRQAQQSEKKPACWRVLHRVTFVSRVLPDNYDAGGDPLGETMNELDISSNWELIQLLDPFVRSQATSIPSLRDAIEETLESYYPELLPHETDIVQFMADYYGLDDEV